MQYSTTLALRKLLLLACLWILSGCLYSAGHQQAADQLVTKLHQVIQQEAWNELPPFYDASFLQQNPAKILAKQWQNRIKKYGKVTKITLQSQQKDPRILGEYYLYSFILLFEHGVASETITVFKPERKEQLIITGHRIREGHGL
ncbi:MAG: hypothetical protein R8J84_02090 [Mariprofundales bacterium]